MIINRWIAFVLAIGAISTLALLYFYKTQRDFTKNHREFTVLINKFENIETDLTHLILQNSLYTYENQDSISRKVKELQSVYINLNASKILKEKNYKIVERGLLKLDTPLTQMIQNIEDYQMHNAAVKNSILFLTRHVENASNVQKTQDVSPEFKNVFIKSIQILKRFNDTKQMQDIDYINSLEFLLHSDSSDKNIRRFVDDFNLHSSFLIKKFPLFLNTTKNALNNDLHIEMHNIKEMFTKIALHDFKAIDIFASILFSVFILSLISIVILFIKYLHENRQLKITKDSLEHSLTYDHLTDLYNRKALEIEIGKIVKPHILLINIDSFKNINDIYGNQIGNHVLKELAELIKEKVSSHLDVKVYRLGGDEFGVLFSNESEENVLKIAQSLEKEIASHSFKIDDLTLQILVSIAINDIYPIMENADLALKELKKDHTKRILVYKKSLHLKKTVQENMDTIELIKSAINQDRIVPFFQPIVNLETLKIEKYEALVRLKLEDGTFLAPYKFLDTAKKTQYYRDITRIMIEKTLKTVKEYPSYRFSINISMTDILDDELVNILLKTLGENKTSASRFDIELLESENLKDISKVQDFIKNVKEFGSKILIDDFGSGYANFSYFSDLDIDITKIDGSIVKEIVSSERKMHMLKSIYDFTKGMQMTNVAEFVESKEIALLLKEIGVVYAQGYYFGKPLERPLESDEVTI